MTQHDLKLNERFFDAINNGIRTFDIRKDEGRFNIGDTIKYYCVDDDKNEITVPNYKTNTEVPLRVYCAIIYILTHDDYPFGVPDGYCVLGIKRTSM